MSRFEVKHILRDALFLDIPYIVDSVLRHAEYRLNRLHRAQPGAAPRTKRYPALPAFALLLLVLIFTAYGPTFGALCALLDPPAFAELQARGGRLLMAAAMMQVVGTVLFIHFRIERRFEKRQLPFGARWIVVHIVFIVVLFAWAVPLGMLGWSVLTDAASDGCRATLSHGPAAAQLGALLLVAAGAAWRSSRAATQRARAGWQAAALIALAAFVSVLPVDGPKTEAAQVPYAHVFGIVAAGTGVIVWIAAVLAGFPLRSVSAEQRTAIQQALRATELFQRSRDDPELSLRRIAGGLVVGVLRKPLQFLLLPSFAVLLVPEGFVWHAAIGGTLASALFIIASTLTARWDRMAQYLRRYFLIGIPYLVSAAVIVVAALRMGGVQYVTTLLNVAPFGVLFVWMVMAYALGWWFEYQVNSVLAARLLELFGAPGQWDHELVRYDAAGVPLAERSRVELDHRYLTGHGMGELLVVGQVIENSTGKKITAFHAYGFLDLFDALLARRDPDTLHDITRRVQLYFALVNLLLAAGIGLLAWHWGRGDRLNTVAAVVSAQLAPAAAAAPPVDLAELIAQDQQGSKPSALVVSASGGGTRAALYTAAVLEGLHRVGADSRVVLLSGVSGGGVAAAYFAAHRNALIGGRMQDCAGARGGDSTAWNCYRERMAMPFIEDVLRGASEWRIQSDEPLGVLLAESFERRLFGFDGTLRSLGSVREVGLILNTTISGHPMSDAPMLDGTLVRLPSADGAGRCEDHERPLSSLAGGRLAFTNLRDADSFQMADPALPAIRMPFVVVGDPAVGLAQAAALNANFPPVFPNARVDLRGNTGEAGCETRSYYVTDGGATENLGLLSALHALDGALPRLQGRRPRDIDIVLAESSAFEFDYQADRGVGAATGGAKVRLTGRLTLELLQRLRQRVHPAEIRVHDLSLPRVFRSRGGFGTHWLFPGNVRVANPLLTPMPPDWIRVVAQFSGLDRHWVTLDKMQLFDLWQALYDREPFCTKRWSVDPDADLTSVGHWICGRMANGRPVTGPDGQPERWEALKRRLSAGGH